MAEERRPRAATEEKRGRLLDATEEIMLKDGYAAVSSRSVATAVGIQASLVHYYFATLDDLFVGVLERRAGPNVERMAEALRSPTPLRSEEHTSELQSLMRNSYAVFCLKKTNEVHYDTEH